MFNLKSLMNSIIFALGTTILLHIQNTSYCTSINSNIHVIDDVKQTQRAFTENNIAVVFASDDNYAMYLGVTIQSMIDNSSSKNNYDIWILDGGISTENKEEILNLIKGKKNFSIRFFNVANFTNKYKDLLKVSGYITLATYNGLFIPEIFTEYDRMVYLDCDIIIQKDIADLYNVDLHNKLIAAVRDEVFGRTMDKRPWKKTWNRYNVRVLKKNDCANYFNAGVEVMNISKMVKEKIFDKYIESLRYIIKKVGCPRFHDQDVLNSVCTCSTWYLSHLWNYFPGFGEWYDGVYPDYHKMWGKNGSDIHIIHYAGEKPWRTVEYKDNIKAGEIWGECAKKTSFYNKIIENNKLNKCELDKILDCKKQ